MMTPSEEIIAFVRRSNVGRRWIDIENEFCNKKGKWAWSKGKFVNHWKKAKKFLERRQANDLKGYRYFIKESSEKEATKLVLAKNLKEQELNTVNIPREELEKALSKLAESLRNVSLNRSKFLNRLKLYNSFKNQLLNFWMEDLRKKSKFWNVFIQHPLGVPTPDLSEAEKYASLKILSGLTSTRTPIEDVEKKSFTVILTYNPSSKEDPEEERQKRLNRRIAAWQKDKGVKKWKEEKHLKEFEKDYRKMQKLFLGAT